MLISNITVHRVPCYYDHHFVLHIVDTYNLLFSKYRFPFDCNIISFFLFFFFSFFFSFFLFFFQEELNVRPTDVPFLFSDEDGWKRVWNIFILILVMYTVIIIPLNFAFPDLPEEVAFDYTVDVLFILDVCFTFRTAYVDPAGNFFFEIFISFFVFSYVRF